LVATLKVVHLSRHRLCCIVHLFAMVGKFHLALFVAAAVLIARAHGASVRVLTPQSFKEDLTKLSGDQRLLVDFTASSFSRLFTEAADSADETVSWASLDCNLHYVFCETLKLEVWTGLRLYHAGDSAKPSSHVEVPIAVFPLEEHEKNVNRLVQLAVILPGGKESARSLVASWAADIRDLPDHPVGAKPEERALVLTDGNFESVMKRVHEEPGHQVFILYHGSLNACEKEADVVHGAFMALDVALSDRVTFATVNCDRHATPCETASVGTYCTTNHFVAANTCRQTNGPKGSALYRGNLAVNDILKAVQKKTGVKAGSVPMIHAGDEL